MADTYTGKKITEFTESTLGDDTDLLIVGNRGTSVLRKFTFANLISYIWNKIMAWKSLSTVTGTTAVTIPAGTTDVMAAVQYNDTGTFFDFNLSIGSLTSSQRTFSTGYYLNASAYAFVQIIATSTSIKLGTVNINGTNHTATSHLMIRYR